MIQLKHQSLAHLFANSRLALGVVDPSVMQLMYTNVGFERAMEDLYMARGENPLFDWEPVQQAIERAGRLGEWQSFSDASLAMAMEFYPFQWQHEGQPPSQSVLCCVFQEEEKKELFYKELLEHSPNSSWACSLNGEVFWTNRASQMYRHGSERHDPSNSGYIRDLHPDDVQHTATNFSTGMVEGVLKPFRFRILNKEGQPNWFMFTGAPVHAPDGRVKYWTGTSFNIEEMVQTENALREEKAALVEDNTRLRAQLAEAQSMLSRVQKTDLVAHLAGGVAHDLNNMLFVMSMHLGKLRRQIQDEALQGSVKALFDGVRNASRLAMQLSGFSGRLPQNAEPLNPQQVLKDAHLLFQQAVGAEVVLLSELDSEVGNVLVDRVYLENAVINLLINARDAMAEGDGRVELSVRAHEEQDRDSQMLPKPYVVVQVKDNGVGMSQALVQRIFEPFFTTKAPDKGTGLGLAMVKNLVESSGGFLRVDSVPGQGTSFEMYFPCTTQAVREQVQEASLLRTGEGIVMLIDDNLEVRLAVSMSLRELGYTLITATHIEQALMLLKAGAAPDVVLSDIRMPGTKTVRDLAAYLKREQPIPLVFITGYSADILVKEGLLDGEYPVLFKPLGSEVLANKLAEVIAKNKGQRSMTH